MSYSQNIRIFNLDDWVCWLNETTKGLFGMSGEAFRVAYANGSLADQESARDVAAILPVINCLQTFPVYAQRSGLSFCTSISMWHTDTPWQRPSIESRARQGWTRLSPRPFEKRNLHQF